MQTTRFKRISTLSVAGLCLVVQAALAQSGDTGSNPDSGNQGDAPPVEIKPNGADQPADVTHGEGGKKGDGGKHGEGDHQGAEESKPMDLKETTPPKPKPKPYERSLADHGVEGMDWFKFGIQHRDRYEYINNEYLNAGGFKNQEKKVLQRTLVKLGIEKIIDPVRLYVEFADMREFSSDYPHVTTDINYTDILQAYMELFFPKAVGDLPWRVQFGRFTMEYQRGRLIGRNVFRNTINSFNGVRSQLGDSKSKWQLDMFITQPTSIDASSLDHGDEEQCFMGVIGAWRGKTWLQIEPYYLVLLTQRDRRIAFGGSPTADQEFQTIGVWVHGDIPGTNFDYNAEAAYQFGEIYRPQSAANRTLEHDAYAFNLEVGYTFKQWKWTPRLAFIYDYGSGDHDPNDASSEQFNDYFPRRRANYTRLSYLGWNNMNSPAVMLNMKPTDKLQSIFRYRPIWLASHNDSWNRGFLQDPAGNSGDYVGSELELRFQYKLTENWDLQWGYVHFWAGDFVNNITSQRLTGAGDTSFAFIEAQWTF